MSENLIEILNCVMVVWVATTSVLLFVAWKYSK